MKKSVEGGTTMAPARVSAPQPKARPLALLLAVVAALGVVGLTAGAAAAATSVSQTTNLVDGQSVTVTGTGLTPSTPHKIGVCTQETYLGIPACDEGVPVTTDASGSFSLSVTVHKTNTNIHKTALPFPLNVPQPATFTCKGRRARSASC
ncbi:neocarzinostatin apoprotein domain-containing protein [Nocardioides humi]|uniref:neocarzinostatin apoprotein domain-containing protein n=1 Tax=Nocardioides humi TaxID=449461 RepID=UPI00112E0B35|nr:neocarzinostatin apoprotein domain-containing protein [Nocardioides humi]